MPIYPYNGCECDDNVTPPVEVPAPPECVDGEPCTEILDAKCVKYTGAAITNLSIATNDRLDTILSKIAVVLTIDPVANNLLESTEDGLKVIIDTTEITRILNAINDDPTMKALFQSIMS